MQVWHHSRTMKGRGGSDKQKPKTINTSMLLQSKQHQIPLEKQSGRVTKSWRKLPQFGNSSFEASEE